MEPWLNVPSEFHPVLVALYGYFAELFSRQLSARTKAGMERARAKGTSVGRPRLIVPLGPILALKAQGLGTRASETALRERKVYVSRSTIRRLLVQAAEAQGQKAPADGD